LKTEWNRTEIEKNPNLTGQPGQAALER